MATELSYTKLNELVRTVTETSDYQTATDAMQQVNAEVAKFLDVASFHQTNAVLWGNYQEAYRIGETGRVAWKTLYDATWGGEVIMVAAIAQDLQREAAEARERFEAHNDICRNRMARRDCLKCDQLDIEAFAAEREYLNSQKGN